MYVYVFKTKGEDFYKVGITKNIPRQIGNDRKRNLQTGNHRDIDYFYSFECPDPYIALEVERTIHKRLKNHRARKKGEWYKVSHDWMETILWEIEIRDNEKKDWGLVPG